MAAVEEAVTDDEVAVRDVGDAVIPRVDLVDTDHRDRRTVPRADAVDTGVVGVRVDQCSRA